MILGVCAFSDQGRELAARIADAFPEDFVVMRDRDATLDEWTRYGFATRRPTLFIGSCGIAVRAVAPYVRDKASDPPIVVVDDCGRYVIPLLSGHLGGANDLAKRIAAAIGATAVVTTATDAAELFAVDEFAKRNALTIRDKKGIQRVSAKILQDRKITIAVAPDIAYPPAVPAELEIAPYTETARVDVIIREARRVPATNCDVELNPKRFVIGCGCKRGTARSTIDAVFERFFQERVAPTLDVTQDEFWKDVAFVATIDVKKTEYGLAEFAQIRGTALRFFTAEELNAAVGEFEESEFVRKTVGVGNVCERAASLCAGKVAELVVKKFAQDGVTFALALRKGEITLWK